MIEIVVYGIAQPAGSKTAGRTSNGRLFVRDSAKGSAAWKRAVAQVAGAEMAGRHLLDGPLALEAAFHLPRPKGHYGARGLRPSAPDFPTVKPDTTKLLRAVEDALTGIVYRDDAQIVRQHVTKDYAGGGPVRVEIRISSVRQAHLLEQVLEREEV
ncbi:MAG: RusA family crossover junction endodeoxyribonuclease [Acidimicrobiia bacterium]